MGCGFLNHMLVLFSRHGRFGLTLTCDGDTDVDYHHTAEDIGIRRERAVNYTQDREGVEATYAVMCEAITSVRKCKNLDAGEWRESLDKDNKRRRK